MRNFMEAYKEATTVKEKLGVMAAAGLISEIPESAGRRIDEKGVIPCTDGVNNFVYNHYYVFKAIRIDYDNPSHNICHGIYSCKIDEYNALDINMIVELVLPDFEINGDEYHFCATRGDITLEIDFIALDAPCFKPSTSFKSVIREIKNDVYIDEKVEQVSFTDLF